jgi:hypothetical protein
MHFCIFTFFLILLDGFIFSKPFFQYVSPSHWILGNELWNISLSKVYATELYFSDTELIGQAKGHYAGYGKQECAALLQLCLMGRRWGI